MPLSVLVRQLKVSKQAAGQLVDTLVLRGYLKREVDEADRRRFTVALTERGWHAAAVQRAERERIDAELERRVGRGGPGPDPPHPGSADRDREDRRMTLKMARVILFTARMEEMSRFYGEVLGLKRVCDEPGWREFAAGGMRIALHSGPATPGRKGPKLVFHAPRRRPSAPHPDGARRPFRQSPPGRALLPLRRSRPRWKSRPALKPLAPSVVFGEVQDQGPRPCGDSP